METTIYFSEKLASLWHMMLKRNYLYDPHMIYIFALYYYISPILHTSELVRNSISSPLVPQKIVSGWKHAGAAAGNVQQRAPIFARHEAVKL